MCYWREETRGLVLEFSFLLQLGAGLLGKLNLALVALSLPLSPDLLEELQNAELSGASRKVFSIPGSGSESLCLLHNPSNISNYQHDHCCHRSRNGRGMGTYSIPSAYQVCYMKYLI
jgi:hypothetical protein